jgi:hypothetical protein
VTECYEKLLFFAVSEMIEEEVDVAYFNVVNQHSSEGSNEDHENIINIIGVPVDIGTRHFRNISQKR